MRSETDSPHRRSRFYRVKLYPAVSVAERTPVINLDKLTYAGNPANLSAITARAMIIDTPSMRVKLSAS